ncbi:mycothiol system anti-sigma-R factor [Corynebacterium diphtheriae]|uniref:mycothiol system anti-sigma-R factor n=1 Tax=Corynebacterium diphtheriae TaxID=1717 RepID=UPI0008FB7EFD|nr:mycothiol system anti-sigma-R factor [Corynebacterium diphtheriae]OIS04713.1 mycothiol system anti-sigma-R factor [Corynebacterium diphtheriae]
MSHEGCSCSELREYMYALLDRELSPVDCARLQAHLAQCPHCAEIVEAETELRGLLKRCCSGTAPATLREKITYSISITQIKYQ